MKWLAVLLVGLLLGCANTIPQQQISGAKSTLFCLSPFGCDVFEFIRAPEEALSTNVDAILLYCPEHYYAPPAREIRPECEALVQNALNLVNERFSTRLEPLKPSDVDYGEGGGCNCTFIPGREAADCYTQIYATITLRWRVPPASKSDF